MNNPGALKTSTQETRTHKQCMALFPYNFLPSGRLRRELCKLSEV